MQHCYFLLTYQMNAKPVGITPLNVICARYYSMVTAVNGQILYYDSANNISWLCLLFINYYIIVHLNYLLVF